MSMWPDEAATIVSGLTKAERKVLTDLLRGKETHRTSPTLKSLARKGYQRNGRITHAGMCVALLI